MASALSKAWTSSKSVVYRVKETAPSDSELPMAQGKFQFIGITTLRLNEMCQGPLEMAGRTLRLPEELHSMLYCTHTP
jgi:hypothetical protein